MNSYQRMKRNIARNRAMWALMRRYEGEGNMKKREAIIRIMKVKQI